MLSRRKTLRWLGRPTQSRNAKKARNRRKTRLATKFGGSVSAAEMSDSPGIDSFEDIAAIIRNKLEARGRRFNLKELRRELEQWYGVDMKPYKAKIKEIAIQTANELWADKSETEIYDEDDDDAAKTVGYEPETKMLVYSHAYLMTLSKAKLARLYQDGDISKQQYTDCLKRFIKGRTDRYTVYHSTVPMPAAGDKTAKRPPVTFGRRTKNDYVELKDYNGTKGSRKNKSNVVKYLVDKGDDGYVIKERFKLVSKRRQEHAKAITANIKKRKLWAPKFGDPCRKYWKENRNDLIKAKAKLREYMKSVPKEPKADCDDYTDPEQLDKAHREWTKAMETVHASRITKYRDEVKRQQAIVDAKLRKNENMDADACREGKAIKQRLIDEHKEYARVSEEDVSDDAYEAARVAEENKHDPLGKFLQDRGARSKAVQSLKKQQRLNRVDMENEPESKLDRAAAVTRRRKQKFTDAAEESKHAEDLGKIREKIQSLEGALTAAMSEKDTDAKKVIAKKVDALRAYLRAAEVGDRGLADAMYARYVNLSQSGKDIQESKARAVQTVVEKMQKISQKLAAATTKREEIIYTEMLQYMTKLIDALKLGDEVAIDGINDEIRELQEKLNRKRWESSSSEEPDAARKAAAETVVDKLASSDNLFNSSGST